MRRLLVLALLLYALPVGAQVNYYPASGAAGIRVLDVKSTAVPTATTSAEVVATYTLPANSLSANNDAVRITAFWSTAANANAKAYNIKLGGIAGDACTARSSTDNAQKATMVCFAIRTGAATQDWWGLFGTAAAAILTSGGTAAQNTAADIAIVATATTGSAAGDVTFEGWIIELIKVQ